MNRPTIADIRRELERACATGARVELHDAQTLIGTGLVIDVAATDIAFMAADGDVTLIPVSAIHRVEPTLPGGLLP